MNHILSAIKSEEYLHSLGLELPPKAMRKVILNTKEYKILKNDIEEGMITDNMIEDYVEELISEFVTGKRFAYDLTLATIAVCYEHIDTPGSNDYLIQLSKSIPHLLSTRIAKECLKNKLKKDD